MFKLFVIAALVAIATALPAAQEKPQELDCLQSETIISCYAVKAAVRIQRAARSSNIEIVDGVSLVRDGPGNAFHFRWVSWDPFNMAVAIKFPACFCTYLVRIRQVRDLGRAFYAIFTLFGNVFIRLCSF